MISAKEAHSQVEEVIRAGVEFELKRFEEGIDILIQEAIKGGRKELTVYLSSENLPREVKRRAMTEIAARLKRAGYARHFDPDGTFHYLTVHW